MNLVIIQARMSSSRLPEKVLLEFSKNKTILDVLIDRINLSKYVDKIVVATTHNTLDSYIIKHCQKSNYEYFIGDEENCLKRHYDCAKLYNPSSVSKIPSDVPFIDPVLIDKVIQVFNSGEFDYVSNLHPPTYPDGMDVETFSFDALRKSNDEATEQLHMEHTTPYIWDNPDIFKIGHICSDEKVNYFNDYRFTVDYSEDYYFLKKIYNKFLSRNINCSWTDLISFVDQNPKIKSINAMHLGINWYKSNKNKIKNLDRQILNG